MNIRSINLFISLFFVLSACGTDNVSTNTTDNENQKKVINARLTHSGSDGNNLDLLVDEFAALIKEKSEGRLNITVYPAGQLYKDIKNPEVIANGAVEMALNSSTLWGNTVPSMEILGIPAVFTEAEQVREALDGEIGQIITGEMRSKGIEPVMFLDYSHIYFASAKEPLTSKENWKNKNVRTPSKTHSEWVKAMGAVPVTMAGTEVIEAISRGMLDGALSGIDSFASRKIYDFTNYYSGPAYYEIFSVTANKKWYDELPDDLKQIINEASAVVEEKSAKMLAENEAKAHKEVQDNGMQLVELKEEDKKAWLEASESLLNSYGEKAGNSGKRILELLGLSEGMKK